MPDCSTLAAHICPLTHTSPDPGDAAFYAPCFTSPTPPQISTLVPIRRGSGISRIGKGFQLLFSLHQRNFPKAGELTVEEIPGHPGEGLVLLGMTGGLHRTCWLGDERLDRPFGLPPLPVPCFGHHTHVSTFCSTGLDWQGKLNGAIARYSWGGGQQQDMRKSSGIVTVFVQKLKRLRFI